MRASDSDGEEGIRRKSPRRSSRDENRRLRFESETERVSVFVLLVVGVCVCVCAGAGVGVCVDPDPDADLSRPLPEFGSTDARFVVVRSPKTREVRFFPSLLSLLAADDVELRAAELRFEPRTFSSSSSRMDVESDQREAVAACPAIPTPIPMPILAFTFVPSVMLLPLSPAT